MKYKIIPGSELFDKFKALKEKMAAVNIIASEACVKLGGEPGRVSSGTYMAGGIEAIHFLNPPDKDLWSKVDKYQPFYRPKAKNKEALAAINDINQNHTMDLDELNEITNYKSIELVAVGNGLGISKSVGVVWGEDVILISTPDTSKYQPVDGMIEILASEYKKLDEEIDAKAAALTEK